MRKPSDQIKPFRYDGQVNHVFTSLCSCETCGGPIVVVTGRKGGYYGCRNSHRQKTCGNNRVVRCQKLETPILRFLADQLNDEEVCKVLAQKYNDLRKRRLAGKIRFLGGADHSEIYITPGVIRNRFQEIPDLLRTSQPFELNKALRGIIGKTGIQLSYRTISGGEGEYWALGSLNIGRALTMVEDLGYGDSAAIKHEIFFEIPLG